MSSPGHWWFKWWALGIGIAALVAWAKVLRTLLGIGLVALVGWWLYKQCGSAARAQFDDGVQRSQPQRAQLLAVLPGGPVPGQS